MSRQKNILVTGANGQLGMEFRQVEALFPGYRFLFTSREQLAIDDAAAIDDFFNKHIIDICINCAAYTAVDKAESEKEIAVAINATAVANLAKACKTHKTQFIHFSTDYVFNGQAEEPYAATASTDPVNFYGHTKLMGEQAALENDPSSIIIRSSWVYSSFGKNFVKTMLQLMSRKEQIGVVADQRGCPTYAADLAAAVMQIIGSDKIIPGIYHYCNEGVISWFEFATAIKAISNSSCIVNSITTGDYPTPARRPAYSALDTQKIKDTYHISIPRWRASLEACIGLLSK